MSKTILVDLSHPFGRGNPLWPSNGDFHIDRVQHMPMHYRLLQTFNDFHMHNSTHADSPSHVIPESPYTHELPLENYYGPAVCLDIPKKHWELITVEDIEKAAAKVEGGIQEGDWVLICTGMNQRWGENDDYFMYSPGMSIEGAHWLVDHKVKGVGFDLQALDHILYTYAAQHGPGPYVPCIVDEYKKEFGHEPIEDYPEWEPVHTILLGNNVMGIENLGGDIEKVKGQRFMFCAFPLRWYMGDGTIVRAVAITDEDHINKDVPDRVYKYGVY
ncbi:cyclase family protein [Flavonifractor plautii]|uniref:cyclase family protein n=1 Tax=Flavonifractor plautii TaxID=292800 RepID=UPI0022E3422F|nr:cyclase family protein [Flavonifractor plautii]MDS9668750.1 cyclase family protein [Flavonifractor plautii]